MCGEEREDLLHFTLKCPSLDYRRNKKLIERVRGEDDIVTLGNLLFRTKEENLEELKEMLQGMWTTRKYKLINANRNQRIKLSRN